MKPRSATRQRLVAAGIALVLAYIVYFLILMNAVRDYGNVALLLILFITAVSCVTFAYVAITGMRPEWLDKALADLQQKSQ